MIKLLRRQIARAAFGWFRSEIEGLVTDRLLLFHEALIARGRILPPQRLYSGDQRRSATA